VSRPKGLPLRRRDGTIRKHALVDPEDYARLAGFKWRLNGRGYVIRSGDNAYLHRVVLGLEPGDRRFADHINGNMVDNRKSNLRVVTPAESAQNRRFTVGRGTSRFRGVSWHEHTRKWRARAGRVYLGIFDDEREAADVAARYRAEHMPFAGEAPAR
jgi:hypothetical protein